MVERQKSQPLIPLLLCSNPTVRIRPSAGIVHVNNFSRFLVDTGLALRNAKRKPMFRFQFDCNEQQACCACKSNCNEPDCPDATEEKSAAYCNSVVSLNKFTPRNNAIWSLGFLFGKLQTMPRFSEGIH